MITWDWRTMGKTAIQVTQPHFRDGTFSCKNQKKGKTAIFFQNMPHYKAGYWTSNWFLTMCSKSMTPDL